MRIILASASERRQELLKRLVSDFDIIISNFDENKVDFRGSIDEYVKEIALGKAMDVRNRVSKDSIIISADTIVTLDNKILGKPKDEKEAFKMLKSLQGKNHFVYSGIVVINNKENIIIQKSLATKVKFSNMSDEESFQYINTKEPMDKAGAYGIQVIGGVFVESIEGCYYNVVGLPLNTLRSVLKEIV